MWTKISICLFLIRIPTSKALIRPLQCGVIFLILSNVILTILWIVQCQPVAKAWDDDIHGSCFSKGQQERIIISQASNITSSSSHIIIFLWMIIEFTKLSIVISAVSDFVFSSYPILILWKVQMKPQTKIALSCLMRVGILYVARSGGNNLEGTALTVKIALASAALFAQCSITKRYPRTTLVSQFYNNHLMELNLC